MKKLSYRSCANYDCDAKRIRLTEDSEIGVCEICLTPTRIYGKR